ncbi:MAG TPA: hypothetical protein VEU08_24260, partial [Vicinamibacterales bacterium]|nr:hypothetical protein [Vicinamibacterales bacterium]
MPSQAGLAKLTGLASRFGAFVAERYPFALIEALEAFESAAAGRKLETESDIDGFRPILARHLAQRFAAIAIPSGLAETTPRVDAAARLAQARAGLAEACDGFLRRAAIAASLPR